MASSKNRIEKLLIQARGVVTFCGLAKWGNYTHKSRLELLMLNKSTNAQ